MSEMQFYWWRRVDVKAACSVHQKEINPKYYDIEHAFYKADEINWKQGSEIKAGDRGDAQFAEH